jgi:AcrR family transcriptional regulator
MPRPRSPLLSRQRIVERALAIIDAHGLEELSTRRLARDLAVRAPSLYNHFATKEEILDAAANEIIAGVDLSMFGREEWPEALAQWARGYRAALVAHPNAVPLIARGPARRPAALKLAETVFGALVRAGWPRRDATSIGAAMRYFVAGSALGSFALGFEADARLYAEDYPHLADAHRLREHQRDVDERAFELGLASMIDGLVRRFAALTAARQQIALPPS